MSRYSPLAARFGRVSGFRADRPLTEEEMQHYAPSVFAAEAHGSRSARYTYIPTIEVLRGLGREGFQPFSVVQARTRLEDRRAFTKHMIRLRPAGRITAEEAHVVGGRGKARRDPAGIEGQGYSGGGLSRRVQGLQFWP